MFSSRSEASSHTVTFRSLVRLVSAFRNSTLCLGTLLYISEPIPTHGHPPIPISRLFDFRPCSDDVASSQCSLAFPLPPAPFVGTPSSTFAKSQVPPGHHLYFLPLFLLIPSIPSDTFCHSYCHLSVPYTWHVVYIKTHLQGDPYPFLFGSPARLVVHV